MNKTVIFERGDHFYLVGPVAPFDPTDRELEELAFADDVRKMAPNQNLWWLRGNYVEAENVNENGQVWATEELEIASLTPMLMPVTVMHDPRTAVGLIADTKLLTPEAASVPRSRIDTTLAVWRHRFPEVADEAAENYRNGTLMQSMECLNAHYDCVACGKRFPKLPGGAEVANWCEHLAAKKVGAARTTAARRLGNVTFTGSGLIFGTRGARGAYSEAHLGELQDEVAEFHERAKSDRPTTRRQRHVDEITIQRSEYDELKSRAAKAGGLEQRVSDLEDTAAKVPDLEKRIEEEEAARTKAEGERDEAKGELGKHEEKARAEELASERLEKLGQGFRAKLGEFTRSRLDEQAGSLSDEEWENRLKECEEFAGVKRDEGGAPTEEDKGGSGTHTREETARSHIDPGGGGGNGSEPSSAERSSVVAGLVRKPK